jgi:hypothetical protein
MKAIRSTALTLVQFAVVGASHLGAQTNLPVYTDSLQNGWQDWSWAAVGNSSQFVRAGSASFAVTADAWEAAYFHHSALDAGRFTNLVFWIHGGAGGGQRLLVQGVLSGAGQTSTNLPALAANAWQQFTIPLTMLGVAGASDFDGFWIQDRSGTTQPTFYLDDITLIGATTPPSATNDSLVVVVDAQRDRHRISPSIYGVAFASSNQLLELNCPLNRSGGNAESRYHWQLNAHNRGFDWYFESLPDSPATPGAAADSFVAACKAGGAEAMLTVPMVGWVARLGANRGRLASYSIAKYGAQTDSDWQWFPDAGNGIRASDGTPITWNDPNDANVPADAAFQRDWIRHLTNRWGRAAEGGVRWYFMDNEPSLWHSTHRDVHPAGATMREVRDKFVAYAEMVKSVDTNAIVAGPEEWGWSGYFYSGFDQQWGATNGWSGFPDRTAHGGWDYLPWFLDQLRQHDANTGRRLLDCFTVHFYPQGGEFSSSTSTVMQLRRNRSTRALWDTNYVDETWIDDKVRLIPRLRQWVATYYPGTKIGLTEYNWGAESHINGATAQADLLGIFGREGLELATRWTTPDTGTPAFNAIKMYRNYDGAKSTFGDISVRASGTNPDELAAFASERSSDGALTVMLVHKRIGSTSPVAVSTTNFSAASTARVWQLTSANTITRLTDALLTNSTFGATLPAQSITLLVIPSQIAPRLHAGPTRSDGTVEFRVEGSIGQHYRVDQSDNLTDWRPFFTNLTSSSSLPFTFPITNAPQSFFRAVTVP